jgi:large subunit ribosomal protein L25
MPEVTIEAELRTESGTRAAGRTRRAGRVPGVVYGHGAETS